MAIFKLIILSLICWHNYRDVTGR